MDTTRVGILASRLMDEIASEYEDHDDVDLGCVMLVVEVKDAGINPAKIADLADTGKFGARVHIRCNDPRLWVQMGLLEYARSGLKLYLDDEDDDDD